MRVSDPVSIKFIFHFFGKFLKKFKKETTIKKPYIEGEFEDIDDDENRKL